MSDSVRPHRRQPTKLHHPWDTPSKNTGVGCHLLLQCMKVKSESEVAHSCPTLRDPMDCSQPGSSILPYFFLCQIKHESFWSPESNPGLIPDVHACSVAQSCLTLCNPIDCSQPARLLCPQDFSNSNTGVGCHFLLLGIFPNQGSNPCLLYCTRILFTNETPGKSLIPDTMCYILFMIQLFYQ